MTRRRIVAIVAGVAASAAILAGCSGVDQYGTYKRSSFTYELQGVKMVCIQIRADNSAAFQCWPETQLEEWAK